MSLFFSIVAPLYCCNLAMFGYIFGGFKYVKINSDICLKSNLRHSLTTQNYYI